MTQFPKGLWTVFHIGRQFRSPSQNRAAIASGTSASYPVRRLRHIVDCAPMIPPERMVQTEPLEVLRAHNQREQRIVAMLGGASPAPWRATWSNVTNCCHPSVVRTSLTGVHVG